MKLSELETEKAYDVLCELAPYVENIMTDTSLVDEISKAVDAEQFKTIAQQYVFIAGKFSKILPILMKTHKEDIFSIVSIVNETTVETIKKQKLLVTMAQIKEITQDKELIDFFKSFKNAEGGE